MYISSFSLEKEVHRTPLPPAPRGQQSIRVRFTYDINGLLEVEVAGKDGQQARLVLQGSGMSEQEVAQRLKELSSLKLHPREQEENRALVARAERLYTVTVGPLRDQVAAMLDWFQGQLSTQEPLRAGRAAKRASRFFDQVEAYVGDVELPFPDASLDGDEEEDQP